jgi:hypothetical protein
MRANAQSFEIYFVAENWSVKILKYTRAVANAIDVRDFETNAGFSKLLFLQKFS